MFLRILLGGVLVAGLMSIAALEATAEDKPGTHTGIVVGVEGTTLTMTDKDGKNEHTHAVPASAAITCDGKACALKDLKKGMLVAVTVEKQGEKNVVTRIDAKKEAP